MNKLLISAMGLAFGAGMTFFLDPQSGRRRRALARDKAFKMQRLARREVGKTAHDVRNRASGFMARARSLGRGGDGGEGKLNVGHRDKFYLLRGRWTPSTRLFLGVAVAGTSLAMLRRRGLLSRESTMVVPFFSGLARAGLKKAVHGLRERATLGGNAIAA